MSEAAKRSKSFPYADVDDDRQEIEIGTEPNHTFWKIVIGDD